MVVLDLEKLAIQPDFRNYLQNTRIYQEEEIPVNAYFKRWFGLERRIDYSPLAKEVVLEAPIYREL